ncbi:MAG: ABC transporter permease [Thermoprotei archaeon]|nr:ABC transporter permease [Thermoprotei archaeon]
MGLKAYIVRRTIYNVILLFFVLTLNFLIFQWMPGDPVAIIASSKRLRPEQVESLKKLFGLDKPLYIRYINYIRNMFTWQFGYSYYSLKPVREEIMARLPNTLLLMGTSTLLAIVIGTAIGVIAAYKRGKLFDVISVTTSLLTYALPTFWMGMIFLLVFGYYLRLFPLAGTMSRPPPEGLLPQVVDMLRHLFLPATTLFLFSYGTYVLLMRSALLEVLTEDYIVTAKAKGLDERTILFKHALRNALLPLITEAAMAFGLLFSGAILTETVFSWEGMGTLLWNAIEFQDYPILQAIFYIIAVSVIGANFIADILYGFVDPRIKYD